MEILLLTNALGKVRREVLNGREYLVAPATTIVPGVLNGSKGALYYPPEEIERNVEAWNGMPIVLNHPEMEGVHVSARRPDVLNERGLGFVFSSVFNDKLQHELWFDVENTRKVDPRVLNALESGRALELSTGLYTDNEPAPEGATFNGTAYDYIARNYRPDHIAILPDEKGACSNADGCGVLVNEEQESILRRFLNWMTGNAWSDAARAAAAESRKAKAQDKGKEGGGKAGPQIKIKAAAAQVAKITAQVAAAKTKLAGLKSKLAGAKTDLKALKGSVKSGAKAGPKEPSAGAKAMADEVKGIYHAGVKDSDIAAAVGKLKGGKRSDAVEAAKAIGVKVAPSASKGKIIDTIKDRVAARKGAAQRMGSIELEVPKGV